MSEPVQLDLLDWLAAQPPGPPVATIPKTAPRQVTSAAVPVHLTRVDLSCNMRRFYSLALATSLFGDPGVERRWGRIGTGGQSRTDWYEEATEAERAFHALARAKRRQGYAP